MGYAFFFFSSRRRHTRLQGDWSSDVCSSDLESCRPHGFQELPAVNPLWHELWYLPKMTLETMLRNLRYRTKGRMGSRSRTKFNSSRRIPPPHDLPVPNQFHISRCPDLTY